MLKIKVRAILFFILLISLSACSGSKKKSTQEGGETSFAMQFIREHVGQYPKAFGLFENEELKSRLEALMSQEADSLYLFWNVETPIQIMDDVVFASGCQQHSCPNHAYYLLMNLETNSINVYVFKQQNLTIYTEQGLIPLPRSFANELKVVKANAHVTDNTAETITVTTEN